MNLSIDFVVSANASGKHFSSDNQVSFIAASTLG
jgi:hypothetical protein